MLVMMRMRMTMMMMIRVMMSSIFQGTVEPGNSWGKILEAFSEQNAKAMSSTFALYSQCTH